MARYPRRRVAAAMLATTFVSGAAGAAVNHALTSKTRTVVVPSAAGTGTGTVPIVQTTRLGVDRKSTRLNSSHIQKSRMPSSA